MFTIKDRKKVGFIFALLYFAICTLLLDFFLSRASTNGVWEWFFASIFLFLVSPIIIIRFIFHENIKKYNLSFGFVGRTMLLSILGLIIYVALGWAIVVYFDWVKFIPVSRWTLGGTNFLIFVDLALTPFVLLSKEFLFRGYLLVSAMPIMGVVGAVLLQAVLSIFLDAYLTGFMIPWQQMILMFMMFTFLGYIAWLNRSVAISFFLVWLHVIIADLFFIHQYS